MGKEVPSFLGLKHLREWLLKSPVGQRLLESLREGDLEDGKLSHAEWLTGTVEGRALLEKAIEERNQSLAKVLAVIYTDGHMDIYGDVRCKVVNVPGTWRYQTLELAAGQEKYIAELAGPEYEDLKIAGHGQVKSSERLVLESLKRDVASEFGTKLDKYINTLQGKENAG